VESGTPDTGSGISPVGRLSLYAVELSAAEPWGATPDEEALRSLSPLESPGGVAREFWGAGAPSLDGAARGGLIEARERAGEGESDSMTGEVSIFSVNFEGRSLAVRVSTDIESGRWRDPACARVLETVAALSSVWTAGRGRLLGSDVGSDEAKKT
jgi:hypothetical protein